MAAIPIPQELLEHPAIKQHPEIVHLHKTYGGVPADADDDCVQTALDYANAVANHSVQHGTKSKRTDPSPRRSARVFRADLLGRDGDGDDDDSHERGTNGNDPFKSPTQSPTRRYRSRSRPPTTQTVKEEHVERTVVGPHPHGHTHNLTHSGSDARAARDADRAAGKRDTPIGIGSTTNSTHFTQIEHRVSSIVQQQHEFQERLMRRMGALEKQVEQNEARNKNRINAYLGRRLVEVTNGRDNVPHNLKPLSSLEVIRTLPKDDLREWLEYYTGSSIEVDEHSAKQALRACIGGDVPRTY